MSEILLIILGIILSLSICFEKATKFFKQLKSDGSAKLGKGFKAEISVVPLEQKSEVCATNTNSTNEHMSKGV